MVGIADAYLKLTWAKHHLELLDFDIAFFSKRNPYTIERHDDLERGRHVLRVTLHNVPDQICLIAGDAIGCMRASLDHLAWSLARGPGKVVNPDNVAFPILERLDSDSRKRFRQQTRGIPIEAVEMIQAFQPYRKGAAYKGDLLWRL